MAPFNPLGPIRPGLLARLIGLAPAAMPLGQNAGSSAATASQSTQSAPPTTIGSSFSSTSAWRIRRTAANRPSGPRSVSGLFLVVPLNLMAAQAIADLANRRIAIRTLTWLAPATAVTIAWWASATLRNAFDGLAVARLDSATALGLHLAFDLLIVVVVITRGLDRWARRRDDRQRTVLTGFLAAVLAVTFASGFREVWFRHRETNDLLMLRAMILRRDRERPFSMVAVVSPDSFLLDPERPAPGGRLRFILRSALPRLPQRDLASADDLLNLPEGQRLVILTGSGQRLSYAVQSRLGLEAIHPGRSGVLDAFATALDAQPVRR